VPAAFVGMFSVKVPLFNVVEPKLNARIARFAWLELYNNTVSNAVANVTELYTIAAEGVQYAVVPEVVGAVAFVTVTPPAA
jgi:hypothetical protein